MYSKSKNIMIVVLLILLATLSLYVIGGNIELQNYQNQIAKFSLKEQAYLEQIDDKGNRLVEQEQIIMSQDQAISSGLLEIDELKEINSQVSVITNTIIDTIIVSHVDTVVQEINGNSYLKLPQQYTFADEYLNFKAEINKVGLSIDNITIFNETTVTIGKERQGFFKPLKPVVKIKNTNTYMNTINVQNVVIENKPDLIHDKRAWGLVGILIGLALN
tara:strand:+ start:251 stop:904 length:654 start_codon:yes stop_codon:yes gene_type:complete